VPADARRIALTTIRRAGAIGLALGLGLGLTSAFPALANTGWHHGSDDNGAAWGLNVAGDDGPAWGLTVTEHGPAFGIRERGHDIHLPVVLDGEGPLSPSAPAWANGVSAFGIDGATITGDNPVADAYLGQSGFNSTTGWRNDREGWLGGLLGDEGWRVGGLF
jgi:hypothetical protein